MLSRRISARTTATRLSRPPISVWGWPECLLAGGGGLSLKVLVDGFGWGRIERLEIPTGAAAAQLQEAVMPAPVDP